MATQQFRALNITPTMRQYDAYQALSVAEFIFFGGGAGGGKSWWLCESRLINAIKHPGYKSFIGREELTRLMKSTYLTWVKVCAFHGIKQGDGYHEWKLNSKYNYIEFGNGSRIDLLDVKFLPSDPLYERFGSTEYTDGALEECGEIHFMAFDVLKSRIGRHKNDEFGIKPTLAMTGNPKKNWTYTVFYLPWSKGQLQEGYAFIQALFNDNPYTAKEYEKSLSGIRDKVLRERLKDGNWNYDATPGTLFEFDSVNDLWTNTLPRTIEEDKFMTADIARMGQDKIVLYFWRGFTLYGKEVYTKQAITMTAQKIKEAAIRENIPYSHIVADEDGIGCLVKGTKVFTPHGWVAVQDIKSGDEIYSKDCHNNLVTVKVKSNIKREKTDIIRHKNGMEFSFSHFLPVKTRKENPTRLKSWDDISLKSQRAYLDMALKWTGTEFSMHFESTSYQMPNGGIKTLDNALDIKGIDFAHFLGWFISEGCFNGKYITISQSAKSRYVNKIRECIKSCGLNHTEKVSKSGELSFSVGNKNLKNWLLKECYIGGHTAHFKKVPDIIRDATSEVIDAFLNSYNDGDGWIHNGERNYGTSSRLLADDIYSLILKIGKIPSLFIKNKKGDTRILHGRTITSTTDHYGITELKEKFSLFKADIESVYEDHVYNLEIEGETHLYMIRFDKTRPFFVHNGGIVDICRGIQGFVNNSTPLPNENARYDYLEKQNFSNLKTQCAYIMAQKTNRHEVAIAINNPDTEFTENLPQELAQYRIKVPDNDTVKMALIPKDEMKLELGRSPDYGDAFIMRGFFTLKNEFSVMTPHELAQYEAEEMWERMNFNPHDPL